MNFPEINRQVVISVVITCIVFGLGVGGYGVWNTKQGVVASVNGQNISKEELYDSLVQQGGSQVLDSLISKKIVQIEAKKQKITVTDSEIQKEIEKYYEQYGGKEGFNQALQSSGYTLAEFKKEAATNITIKKLLKSRVKISDKEAKEYFEQNKASFAQEKQVKASHILVKTEEEAKKIKEKLANGEDFAKLAKENSVDTGSKDNGGELGFFGSGQMVKEFEDVAFALKVGQISEPVKTQYGYHIIKVEDIKGGQAATYEQKKAEITDLLFEQKVQAEYQTWMQELTKKYKIENSLDKTSKK